jgi:hypothetical protein
MTVLQLSTHIQHDRVQDTRQAPITALHERVKGFDLTARARRQAEERAEALAWDAVLTADSLLTGSFRDTLDTVVQAMSWTGHPPVPEKELMASAVTFLGSADATRGWWLHYTRRPDHHTDGDQARVLTLIAPCDCGAYVDVELIDEDALIVLMDELDTQPGAPVPCDYTLRIRRTSYDDDRHSSTEPAF